MNTYLFTINSYNSDDYFRVFQGKDLNDIDMLYKVKFWIRTLLEESFMNSADKEEALLVADIKCYLIENGPFDKRELLLEIYDQISKESEKKEEERLAKIERYERDQLNMLKKKYEGNN